MAKQDGWNPIGNSGDFSLKSKKAWHLACFDHALARGD